MRENPWDLLIAAFDKDTNEKPLWLSFALTQYHILVFKTSPYMFRQSLNQPFFFSMPGVFPKGGKNTKLSSKKESCKLYHFITKLL